MLLAIRHLRQRGVRFLLITGLILPGLPRTTVAATPAEIQSSIDRAKAWLYKQQKKDNWELLPKPNTDPLPFSVSNLQFGGMTAIATYALLSAGEDPRGEKLKPAIDWLKKADLRGVYAISLRAQVWTMVPPDDSVRTAIRNDRDLLLKAGCTKGNSIGFFGYGTETPKDQSDKSVSQFAVLGLWSLSQAGAEVPGNAWRLFEEHWRLQQMRDGGWCYDTTVNPDPKIFNSQPTMSMTAAGVATLFITQDYTSMAPQCAGNVDDGSIAAGMKYLGAHFNEIKPDRFYYTLFGLSRVGLASGFKYIGTTNWFEWGADALFHRQDPQGFWTDLRDNWNNVPETSFGLLFLSRGRAPVMMNKLQYDVSNNNKSTPAPWNQRPRDVANLTRMISKQIEAPQSWEIVNLRQGANDLHDAPILYMSGNAAPKLSPADQDKLKAFIEEGGLVVGHADCGSASFTEGFHKLGQAMFRDRFFGPLPENHSIYTAQNFQRSRWKTKPVVEGLDNGSRVLMLLLPSGDPARTWQTQAFPSIKQDIFGQLMINVLLYAEDQQGLRQKGLTYLVSRRVDVKADRTVKLARLKYNGNWDPEPGGWRRLSNVMHNERRIDLDAQPVELGQGKLNNTYQAAELSVAGSITLNDAERAELKTYVDQGGTLVVDVAGGTGLFKTNAEAELAKLFPDTGGHEPAVLPLSSPIYRSGAVVTEVEYRHSARAAMKNLRTPCLRGIERENRVAVVYSPEDLVTGLVGQQVGGIVGYAPDSATRLMANVLTYAATH